jgi:DNA/RNA endonuclease G (NUC1)
MNDASANWLTTTQQYSYITWTRREMYRSARQRGLNACESNTSKKQKRMFGSSFNHITNMTTENVTEKLNRRFVKHLELFTRELAIQKITRLLS